MFEVKDASGDAVRGDFNALSLLEYHLVSNSAKFTEKGQVPAPVKLRVLPVVSCGTIFFWDIVMLIVCVCVFLVEGLERGGQFGEEGNPPRA